MTWEACSQRETGALDAMAHTLTSFTKRMPARLTVAGVAFLREWISKIIRIAAVRGIRSFDTSVNTCEYTRPLSDGFWRGSTSSKLNHERGFKTTKQYHIEVRRQHLKYDSIAAVMGDSPVRHQCQHLPPLARKHMQPRKQNRDINLVPRPRGRTICIPVRNVVPAVY